MFNDYKDQFKEQQERTDARKLTSGINPVMVGNTSVLILGINPTQNQLNQIIGDVAEKFDTTYKTTPDQYNDNKPSRPVSFWLTDKNQQVSPTVETLRLINAPREFRTGNKQWFTYRKGVNKNGEYTMLVTSWGADKEVGKTYPITSLKTNNEYTDTIISQVRVGEEAYYNLIKIVTKWPEDASFLEAMRVEGLDFDTVVNGNYAGLHNLVKWINATKTTVKDDINVEEPDFKTFIGIFTAKTKDDTIVQTFCMNPKTWFIDNHGELTKGMRKAIEKEQEDGFNRDGKDIIKGAYTLNKLTNYSEEVVSQATPTTPVDVEDWGI